MHRVFHGLFRDGRGPQCGFGGVKCSSLPYQCGKFAIAWLYCNICIRNVCTVATQPPLSWQFSPLSVIPVCPVISEIPTLRLPLCDNECRSSPSYVFSGAWRLVSAHGPLIINLALRWPFDHSSTLYLYDSDLTSSSGLSFAFISHTFSCFLLGLLSWTSCADSWSKHPKAPKSNRN